MRDTIQAILNFFFAALGFISILGIFVGIPAGVYMIATSGNQKDPKAKTRRIIWSILLIVIPPFLIILTLASFAMVNTILGSATAGA